VKSPGSVTARGSVFFNAVGERGGRREAAGGPGAGGR
jgi:hypothetical protein